MSLKKLIKSDFICRPAHLWSMNLVNKLCLKTNKSEKLYCYDGNFVLKNAETVVSI